jgi:hypothetical protein
VGAYLKMSCKHVPGGTEENHGISAWYSSTYIRSDRHPNSSPQPTCSALLSVSEVLTIITVSEGL